MDRWEESLFQKAPDGSGGLIFSSYPKLSSLKLAPSIHPSIPYACVVNQGTINDFFG